MCGSTLKFENISVLFHWHCNLKPILEPEVGKALPMIIRYMDTRGFFGGRNTGYPHPFFFREEIPPEEENYDTFVKRARFTMNKYLSGLIKLWLYSYEGCNNFSRWLDGCETLDMVGWLLGLGVDPNDQVPFSRNFSIFSPLTLYLLGAQTRLSVTITSEIISCIKLLIGHGADFGCLSWGILEYSWLCEPSTLLGLKMYQRPRVYVKFNGWALLYLILKLQPDLKSNESGIKSLKLEEGEPVFEIILVNYQTRATRDRVSKVFSDEQSRDLGTDVLKLIVENRGLVIQSALINLLRSAVGSAKGQEEDIDQYLQSKGLIPLGGNHTLSEELREIYSSEFENTRRFDISESYLD